MKNEKKNLQQKGEKIKKMKREKKWIRPYKKTKVKYKNEKKISKASCEF